MKYRVGDRVYCIKDKKSPDGILLYSKGNFYTIENYRVNFLELSSDNNYSFVFFLYLSSYILNDNDTWLFNEYFITLKEFRKQKLDKLNEVNLY